MTRIRRIQQLRQSRFSDPELNNHAQDVQNALDQNLPMELRTVEMFYKEPIVLGQLDEQPAGIELIRVVNLMAPEVPMQCGSMCHYVWKPQLGGAQILSIDGLSTVIHAGLKLRLTFRLTYTKDLAK